MTKNSGLLRKNGFKTGGLSRLVVGIVFQGIIVDGASPFAPRILDFHLEGLPLDTVYICWKRTTELSLRPPTGGDRRGFAWARLGLTVSRAAPVFSYAKGS